MEFKWFLFNESKVQLGKKVGDVLSAVHELEEDMPNMGSRHLIKSAQEIVNHIRRILHTSWPSHLDKELKSLQKAAINIMKAIDEKGDLKLILSSVANELENVSTKLGVKTSELKQPNQGQEVEPKDMEQTGEKPESPQEEPPPPPNQPSMSIPMTQPMLPMPGMEVQPPPPMPGAGAMPF